MLAAAAVLLVAFVLIQLRSKHPLLPLRIVLDRDRGGAYLAMGMAGAGMFGVFLFLTFYLQNTLGFSPIQSGLAFLPMSAAIIATATTATTRLVPRVGAEAAGHDRHDARRGRDGAASPSCRSTRPTPRTSSPACVLLGVGLGLVFAPAFSAATVGVAPQRRGRRLGDGQHPPAGRRLGRHRAALARWPAAPSRATPSSTAPRRPRSAAAAVHGYTTAFWWSAAIFALGAIVSSLVFRGGVPQTAAAPAGEPVLAH